MTIDSGDPPQDPEPDPRRLVTVSLSPAFLLAEEEKDHYGLYRQTLTTRWDETAGDWRKDPVGPPLGPLQVFRKAKRGEVADLRTNHPDREEEMFLVKVFDARTPTEG